MTMFSYAGSLWPPHNINQEILISLQPSPTGLGGDLTVWIQTLSAMTRHASCSNVSKLQHFNFKETLIVKNKFNQ